MLYQLAGKLLVNFQGENEFAIPYAKIIRSWKKMEIENRMVVDDEWDESEYGIPNKARIKKQRRSYEEEEYGWGMENEYIV